MMIPNLSSPVYDKVLRRNIANFLTIYWYDYQEERCRRWLMATWYYTGYQPVPTTRFSHVRVALGSDCTCEVDVGTSSMSRPHLRWGMSKLAFDDVPVR